MSYFRQSESELSNVNCYKYLEDMKYEACNRKGLSPPPSAYYKRLLESLNKKTQISRQGVSCFANEFIHTTVELADELNTEKSMQNNNEEHSGCQVLFPFKQTPSGHFKVKSNQVVFQSPTIGVLLADPTQAKVKVKFEDQATSDFYQSTEHTDLTSHAHQPLCKLESNITFVTTKKRNMRKCHSEKDLLSLGYTMEDAIDWSKVHLPKKIDMFQELRRRIVNFINPDTIVHIGNDEFHCHMLVLQAYSGYFDSLKTKNVELPVMIVSMESFHLIYEWMMSMDKESVRLLKRDNVLNLYIAAQYLSIKDLEDQCLSFIADEKIFSEDTAFILYRQAKQRGNATIMDLMVPRVKCFFLPLVASRDFLDLDVEEVIVFLSSNHISITSEMEVLMSAIRWLYGDWVSRRKHTIDVMKCVRFGLISPWQLIDIKRNPDNPEILDVLNDVVVQKMVDDGLAYVIIKYWYNNSPIDYKHWIETLGLVEPLERNWIGEELKHVTYQDFLKYLEQYLMPKEKAYQQIELLAKTKRESISDVSPVKLFDMRKNKTELPTLLRCFTGFTQPGSVEKQQTPVSEPAADKIMTSSSNQLKSQPQTTRHGFMHDQERVYLIHKIEQQKRHIQKLESEKFRFERQSPYFIEPCVNENANIHSPPVRELRNTHYQVSSDTASDEHQEHEEEALRKSKETKKPDEKRAEQQAHCSYKSPERMSIKNESFVPVKSAEVRQKDLMDYDAPVVNKMSHTLLGPPNCNYQIEGSLFNWDRETVLVFGGVDPHSPYGGKWNTGNEIISFDPENNVWELVGKLGEPRHHHAVAFMRGKAYVVGGADPREQDLNGKSIVVNTVWSFDPVNRKWSKEKSLITGRKNFGLIAHKKALYAIGGQNSKGRILKSVERFDPMSGVWSEICPMLTARMGLATAKYRDFIWAAGGLTDYKRRPLTKIVECYNSSNNQWTEINDLRIPRCFATFFTMNDKLYIVGGAGRIHEKEKATGSINAIDVWDWKDQSWKLVAEMVTPRHGHTLAYLGTQMFIIGGVSTVYRSALASCECWCCERSAFIRGLSALPHAKAAHAALTLPPGSLMQ